MFSKIYLSFDYHHVSIKDEYIHKIVFIIRYKHYEFVGVTILTYKSSKHVYVLNEEYSQPIPRQICAIIRRSYFGLLKN